MTGRSLSWLVACHRDMGWYQKRLRIPQTASTVRIMYTSTMSTKIGKKGAKDETA